MNLAMVPVMAGVLLLAGCGKKPDRAAAPATNGSATASSPADAPGNYLRAIAQGQQSAVKTVDTTSLEKAVQLFNVDNGRNPKDLNELVQKKYIPKLPEPPFGSTLVYNSIDGSVKIEKQ